MSAPLEVALVGCGAIAQVGYLPALRLVPEVRCRWLVDVQRGLAEHAARRWGIPRVAAEMAVVLDAVEAVILAVPNHLHASLAREALARGRAVLCEKPLARTADEVRAMVAAARDADVPLVAGMIVRQYPGLQRVRARCPWEALGEVREITARYGIPLDWPVASTALLERERAGGGAWLDKGSHLLDAVLWAIDAKGASILDYRDDAFDGLEAEARGRLSVTLPSGVAVPCLVEVSHLRRLDNRIAVVGERASLAIPLSGTKGPVLTVGSDPPRPLDASLALRGGPECFAAQLRGFARRVRGLDSPCADGESQIPVLELIEAGYAIRQALTHPWHAYAAWDRG